MDITGDHTDETLTGSDLYDDSIKGMAGDDSISGLGGNDTLEGGPGEDTLYGGEGNDRLEGDAHADALFGGGGDDTLRGGAADDSISGEDGNDDMDGDAGNDSLSGGGGNDTMSGSAGADTLHGGAGDDAMNGDTGEAGNDQLFGEDGNDTLNGGAGDDHMEGGTGDDVLVGGPGANQMWGGDGNDTITGGLDPDRIEGGDGDDDMTGGDAADSFVFNFEVSGTFTQEQVTAWFRDGGKPAAIADYSAWKNYDSQLDAWRAEMFALHGADLLAANTYDLDIKVSGGTAKKPTTAVYHFDGDASYSYIQSVLELTVVGEGHDLVRDWTAQDILTLNGLSGESADIHYWGNVLTVDADAQDGKTVFSFAGGSITLVGVDTTMEALILAQQVVFG